MFAADRKFKRSKDNREPTELEKNVAQSIFDLEVNNKDLKTDLQPLKFTAAQEIAIKKTDKKAIVIFVPLIHIGNVQRSHTRLVRELEKKYSKHIIIVGQRKAETRKMSKMIKREYKHTLTAVHEALLEDVCFPVEVVAKRTRVRADGKITQRVFLDPKEEDAYKHKLATFDRVYKMLTGKRVKYQFTA